MARCSPGTFVPGERVKAVPAFGSVYTPTDVSVAEAVVADDGSVTLDVPEGPHFIVSADSRAADRALIGHEPKAVLVNAGAPRPANIDMHLGAQAAQSPPSLGETVTRPPRRGELGGPPPPKGP